MTMTDPIADMLTRLRNANSVLHDKVEIPGSKIKKAIASVLKEEGFIKDFTFTENNKQGVLTLTLKYGPKRACTQNTRSFRRCWGALASPLSPRRRAS